MGFMIMSCGLGAYAAALWHIVAHGLFKAWLFLGSGSTIGMKPATPAGQLSRPLSLAVAGVTAGAALALVASGKAEPSLVPLLLGAVTAMATLASCFAGKAPVRTRIALLAGIAVLVAFHGLGLALSERAVAGDAPALVPGWALLVLLGAFLGLWLWQQQRLAAGRGLPLPLYVHFINAGALHPLVKGDDK
jgi:formate hydrogenlyase subunit 3/multisubunit Na+/H+ antiporter MnhD subunit